MRNNSGYGWAKRIINSILIFLFFVSVAGSMLSIAISSALLSEDYFVDSLTKPDYISALKDEIDYQLTIECNKNGIKSDAICAAVTETDIKNVTSQYAKSLYNALHGGNSQSLTAAYPRDKIASAVEQILSAPEYNNSIYIDADMREELISNLTSQVTGLLNMLERESLINYAAKFLSPYSLPARFANLKIVFAGLSVLSALAVFLLTAKTIPGAMYALSGAGFIASTLCFAPIQAINSFNIGGKLALGTSTLKIFAKQLINSVLGKMNGIFLTFLICFSVLLIASAALYIFFKKSKVSPPDDENEQ